MNELDFLDALNDIDDDILLKAKEPLPLKPRVSAVFAKLGVAAAVICLLSISVMAVSFGVRIMSSDSRVPIAEHFLWGFFAPSSKVTTVDYSLSAQKIDLPTQWSDALKEEWNSFGYDHTYFRGTDLKDSEGKRIDYGGISGVEKLLGISLVSSPEMEAVCNSAFVKLVITDPERAAAELSRGGEITPDGLEVYFPFLTRGSESTNARIIDYCGLYVYIPLTDSFVNTYKSHVVLSAVGDQDLKEEKYVSQEGIETALLFNTQSTGEAMKAYAAWESRGNGYLLEMKTYNDVTAEPAEWIRTYLKHLEE